MRGTWGYVASLCVAVLVGAAVDCSAQALGDNGPVRQETYNAHIKKFGTDEITLPTSFSWFDQGLTTLARDQGSCDGSWAFASIGVIESRRLLQQLAEADLSEQRLLSCLSGYGLYGCCGGNLFGLAAAASYNQALESCTGYPDGETTCGQGSTQTCSQQDCGPITLSDEFYTVEPSPDQIKASVYTDGPAYLRFDAYSDLLTAWKETDTVYRQQTRTYLGGHAVLLVGWDDTREAWLCKNSWGESTGPNDDGTFWLAYDGHAVDTLNIQVANLSQACPIGDADPASKPNPITCWQNEVRNVGPCNGPESVLEVVSEEIHQGWWGKNDQLVFYVLIEKECDKPPEPLIEVVVEGDQSDGVGGGHPRPGGPGGEGAAEAVIIGSRVIGYSLEEIKKADLSSDPPGYYKLTVPLTACHGVLRSTLRWRGVGTMRYLKTCIEPIEAE